MYLSRNSFKHVNLCYGCQNSESWKHHLNCIVSKQIRIKIVILDYPNRHFSLVFFLNKSVACLFLLCLNEFCWTQCNNMKCHPFSAKWREKTICVHFPRSFSTFFLLYKIRSLPFFLLIMLLCDSVVKSILTSSVFLLRTTSIRVWISKIS